MANRIAGITVEIGGDTAKLNKALETVNGTIKGTQSQLKDVEKLLKLDPTNTELLAQKQSLLTQAVAGTSEKLEVLKTAAQQAQSQLDQGKITQEQFNALQREIAETSNTMEQYNGKLSDSNSASAKLKTTISQQESELSSLKKQYTDVVLEQGKDSDAAKDLQSKYDQLIDSLTNTLKFMINNGNAVKVQMIEKIQQIENDNRREILIRKYIKLDSIIKISKEMFISRQGIYYHLELGEKEIEQLI